MGPSPNCGHYTSIAEGANGTFYRFDDASVSPTSLQNALNTSAYVIFYEMLKTTQNQIVTEGIKTKPDKTNTSTRTGQRVSVIVPNIHASKQAEKPCNHKIHLFKEMSENDNCAHTEKVLQLRLTLSSVFQDKKKPRNFSKMLLDSYKQHFPQTNETTRSLSMKLSLYDRSLIHKELILKSGKVNWSPQMIQNIKLTREEALDRMSKEAQDETIEKPRSLSSYWQEAWEKLYPPEMLQIDFKRVISR